MKQIGLARRVAFVLILFFVSSCGLKNIGPPPDLKPDTERPYIIGPEDVLRIDVWKQPNISVTVPVRSDGKISVPLVNDIQAAGLTPEQLRNEIAKGLTKFIEDPTVSVIVQAINSVKITISGNVNAPGVYKVGGSLTLLEAVSMAGGLSEYADGKKVRILRKEKGGEKMYQVNYKAAVEGKDMSQNIRILPGDSIIVP
jgi:polysaccharide export outer membrane protein